MSEWQPISEAKKGSAKYLLALKNPIPNQREDVRRFDGLVFVGTHPGVADDGFDIGWHFAAPVGCGGFPDEWFYGFQPCPAGAPQPPQEDE